MYLVGYKQYCWLLKYFGEGNERESEAQISPKEEGMCGPLHDIGLSILCATSGDEPEKVPESNEDGSQTANKNVGFDRITRDSEKPNS